MPTTPRLPLLWALTFPRHGVWQKLYIQVITQFANHPLRFCGQIIGIDHIRHFARQFGDDTKYVVQRFMPDGLQGHFGMHPMMGNNAAGGFANKKDIVLLREKTNINFQVIQTVITHVFMKDIRTLTGIKQMFFNALVSRGQTVIPLIRGDRRVLGKCHMRKRLMEDLEIAPLDKYALKHRGARTWVRPQPDHPVHAITPNSAASNALSARLNGLVTGQSRTQ